MISDSNPEISVLMSCYNASRWLDKAIESVLAQSFKDFELIIVNDGSTDETWNIIQGYRECDKRVVAVSKENSGLADSLNFGIMQARGKWIARLDADDLCEERRLEEQIEFVRGNPEVVLLGSGFFEIDEKDRIIKKHLYPSSHHKLTRNLIRLRRFFPHSSAFFRVDEARRVGAYNLRFCRAQDWRLWTELVSVGKVACISKPLVRIRKHKNQVSHDNNGRRQISDGTAAIVCHLLRKAGYKDPSADMHHSDEWNAFSDWIENRIEESGIFERRKAWADARNVLFYCSGTKLYGIAQFAYSFFGSRHAGSIIWEKLFGSPLPKRLAKEWIGRSCAVS